MGGATVYLCPILTNQRAGVKSTNRRTGEANLWAKGTIVLPAFFFISFAKFIYFF